MKRVKKILYGIDDYIKDRVNGGVSQTKSVVNQGIEQGQGYVNQGANYVQNLLGLDQNGQNAPASVQTEQQPQAQAPATQPTQEQAVQPTATQPSGINQVTANVNATRPLTQVELAKNQMEQARQKVYDVLNQKFVYNAKDSPLYTILQQQYERDAQRAEGEAYARATANTGGYGSSYASNVASEARRKTMEGFNDQQYALYQAAKDEFLTERQSAVDWYNQTKQMYNDIQDEALMSAYEAAYNVWDGSNEEAVRASLTEQGVSATNINKIMTALKKEKLDNIQTDTAIKGYEEDAMYTSAMKSASALWNGSNESEVRTALLAQGVDAATVNSIVSTLKTGTRDDLLLDADIAEIQETQAYKKAMNEARSIWATNQSESAVREALSGYSATIVDAIVSTLKAEALSAKGDELTGAQIDQSMADLQESQAYKTAMNEARSIWATNQSESAVREALSGYSATIVDDIVQTLKVEQLEGAATDEEMAAIKDNKAYRNAVEIAAQAWANSNSLDDVKAALEQAGVSYAVANKVFMETWGQAITEREYQVAEKEIEYTEAYNEADELVAKMSSEGKTPEEIRAALAEANVPYAVARDVMLKQLEYDVTEAEWNAALTESEEITAGGLTEEEKTNLVNGALDIYDGTNKGQVEEVLKNNGASDEEAKEIIGQLENIERAGLDDTAKNISEISSAVSYKSDLDRSKANGTLSVEVYDQRIKENSGKIMNMITPNLNDPDKIDYQALGISKTDWENMDDADKKLSVMEAVGQLARDGVVTRSDYEKLLYNDTQEFFNSSDYKNSNTKTRDTVDRAIVIQDLYDSGYLLKDQYTSLLYNDIVPKMSDKVIDMVVKWAQESKKTFGMELNVNIANMASESLGVNDTPFWSAAADDGWKACSKEQKEMLVIIANHLANKKEEVTNKASDKKTRVTLG